MPRLRFRNFVFTLNNYSETEVKTIKELKNIYIIFGYEVGKENQTPHLQGYCEMKKQLSLKGVKNLFGADKIHIEKRKGSQIQAIEYCKKEGNFIEVGTPNTMGKRTDLSVIKDMIKSGKKLTDILDTCDNLNYQNIKGAILLKSLYSIKRTTKPIIIWLYGSTGIGKSRYVYTKFQDIYSSCNSKWFDGYEQNNVILIDDYRRDYMKFHVLLKFLDRYPFTRELKGSTIQINSKYIIFTSPKNPVDTWKGRTNEDLNQLLRRIDIIINFDLRMSILCR